MVKLCPISVLGKNYKTGECTKSKCAWFRMTGNGSDKNVGHCAVLDISPKVLDEVFDDDYE